MRVKWPPVIAVARQIVESSNVPMTLRATFYRLVADQLVPNTPSAYQRLSKLTAAGRRSGEFPDLEDRTRGVWQQQSFAGISDALDALAYSYRLDRTIGQEVVPWLIVEKDGLLPAMQQWFGDYGVPLAACRGYPSQTLVDKIRRRVDIDGRPAVLLYAGDFDPSGEDILRDLLDRTDGVWQHVEQVALTQRQVVELGLPESLAKEDDARAKAFVEKYGRLAQVEVDALFGVDPEMLRRLFEDALAQWWDPDAHDEVIGRENDEFIELRRLAEGVT